MSSKSRRRITMAAGAAIAGAAIPVAAAFNAWADEEITYDGKVIFDNFDTTHPFGSSDVGTAAESGLNNDWAEVYGPASYGNDVGLANDMASTDSGDFALYQGTAPPSAFFGSEGALITNATNSNAEVYGGGNAIINDFPPQFGADPGLVTGSTAVASNGGTALIGNDGLTPSVTTMTGDYASANGTANGTSTVAEILDGNYDSSDAANTGFNPNTFIGGSSVDLANNSSAYASGAGSDAEVGNVTANGGPVIMDSSNTVTDGKLFDVVTSNTFDYNGTPLFGAAATAAEATAAHGSSFADIVPELFGSTASSSVDSFSNLWADLAGLF